LQPLTPAAEKARAEGAQSYNEDLEGVEAAAVLEAGPALAAQQQAGPGAPAGRGRGRGRGRARAGRRGQDGANGLLPGAKRRHSGGDDGQPGAGRQPEVWRAVRASGGALTLRRAAQGPSASVRAARRASRGACRRPRPCAARRRACRRATRDRRPRTQQVTLICAHQPHALPPATQTEPHERRAQAPRGRRGRAAPRPRRCGARSRSAGRTPALCGCWPRPGCGRPHRCAPPATLEAARAGARLTRKRAAGPRPRRGRAAVPRVGGPGAAGARGGRARLPGGGRGQRGAVLCGARPASARAGRAAAAAPRSSERPARRSAPRTARLRTPR